MLRVECDSLIKIEWTISKIFVAQSQEILESLVSDWGGEGGGGDGDMRSAIRCQRLMEMSASASPSPHGRLLSSECGKR